VTDIGTREVRPFSDLEALSIAAAEEIVAIARASVAARGRFTVALAGGNTPRRTYELLATRHRDAIDWTRTEIVFGDERFVPPDDKRSNYRMAREALLAVVPIPAERVHPVPIGARVYDAAAAYDLTLEQLVGAGSAGRSPSDVPVAATIDLVLLGVGPDGHTASLFPGSPAVGERSRYALAVDAPTTVQPAVPRITTTFPFLNGARVAMFLVAGADKRPVIGQILEGGASARRYPAALVAARERTLWMIDQSAMPDDRSNA
jgi:6-phosphogluconolactonase